MSGKARRPRADGDLRDRYPLLAEWVEADRQDTGLGARVVERLTQYRMERATGPTWYAVAEWARPDLELVPDAARRWYASQLVNRLIRQGWLVIDGTAQRGPGGVLKPGPRAQQLHQNPTSPEPAPPPDPDDQAPHWIPGRLF